jgi:hypothetical protein
MVTRRNSLERDPEKMKPALFPRDKLKRLSEIMLEQR